jgi:hypothetical protein
MAYMNQQQKSELAPGIKAVLKKYGIKGTIGVRNHMTLVVNIKSGKFDIIENWYQTVKKLPRYNYGETIQKPNHIQVNEYYIDEHYSGEVKDFLLELKDAMNIGNHDNSDIQSDYFDVGFYTDINIGQWDKPYTVEV